jgi:hypothetical protein
MVGRMESKDDEFTSFVMIGESAISYPLLFLMYSDLLEGYNFIRMFTPRLVYQSEVGGGER